MSDALWKEISDLRTTMHANDRALADKLNELGATLNQLNQGLSAKIAPLEKDLTARNTAKTEREAQAQANETAVLKKQVEDLTAELTTLKDTQKVAAAAASVAKK